MYPVRTDEHCLNLIDSSTFGTCDLIILTILNVLLRYSSDLSTAKLDFLKSEPLSKQTQNLFWQTNFALRKRYCMPQDISNNLLCYYNLNKFHEARARRRNETVTLEEMIGPVIAFEYHFRTTASSR